MFKRSFIFIILIAFLALPFIWAQETKKKEAAKPEESKAVAEKPTDENDQYDFRKVRWGMTPDEVMKQEEGLKREDGKLACWLYKNVEVAGYKTQVVYQFYFNKLVLAYYQIKAKHAVENQYIDDYRSLEKVLEMKYGKPEHSYISWKRDLYKDEPDRYGFAVSIGDLVYESKWHKNTYSGKTDIFLILEGSNYKIDHSIRYIAPDFKDIENERKKKLAGDL